VYEDDALELGRITAWEPGKRLAWRSSVDDVNIDVSFAPAGDGCLVRVEASLPAGGQDRGGTAWVRVTPKWFGPWCARRDSAPHQVRDLARLALGISTPGRLRRPGGWPARSASHRPIRCPRATTRCPRPGTAIRGSSSASAIAR
jgi:hypothetical protein